MSEVDYRLCYAQAIELGRGRGVLRRQWQVEVERAVGLEAHGVKWLRSGERHSFDDKG